MTLLNGLFSTDCGLMGINGIGFTLCTAAFFLRMLLVQMNEPMHHLAAHAGGGSSGTKAQPPSR